MKITSGYNFNFNREKSNQLSNGSINSLHTHTDINFPNAKLIPGAIENISSDVFSSYLIANKDYLFRPGYNLTQALVLPSPPTIGAIDNLVLSNVGSNYIVGEDLQIDSSYNIVTPAIIHATSVTTLGGISEISASNTGTAYIIGDILTVMSGDNNATIIVDNTDRYNRISSGWSDLTFSNKGHDYAYNDQITISGGLNDAVINIISTDEVGGISKWNWVYTGTAYSTGTNIATSGGNGSGLTVNINSVEGTGEITNISVYNEGSGYTTTTNVSTTGAGNNDFTIDINSVNAGAILAYEWIDHGAGYIPEENVAILSGKGGSGYGATANIVSVKDMPSPNLFTILTSSISNAGSGYQISDKIDIPGGSEIATLYVDSVSELGEVTGYYFDVTGFGYSVGKNIATITNSEFGTGFTINIDTLGNLGAKKYDTIKIISSQFQPILDMEYGSFIYCDLYNSGTYPYAQLSAGGQFSNSIELILLENSGVLSWFVTNKTGTWYGY